VDDVIRLHDEIIQNKFAASESNGDIDPSSLVVPLVLVGNKVDLTTERRVTYHRGKELSGLWKCSFYETSAKKRTNTDVVFDDVVEQIIAMKESMGSKEGIVDENESTMWNIWGCLNWR
jgi:GTPase SAR1 family protein